MKKVFLNPFSEKFIPTWELWKEYKEEQWKFKYKSVITEQAAMAELSRLSEGIEEMAVCIIMQSISHGWKGFFPLKTLNLKENGTTKQAANSTATRESLNDLYNQRFGKSG